jgi:hypothetical protein
MRADYQIVDMIAVDVTRRAHSAREVAGHSVDRESVWFVEGRQIDASVLHAVGQVERPQVGSAAIEDDSFSGVLASVRGGPDASDGQVGDAIVVDVACAATGYARGIAR